MRRVMLKLSGEALASDSKFGFDYSFVDSVCKQINKVVSKNTQVLIMTGGGNFIRGNQLTQIDKYKADEIGMLSTCMNSLFISSVLKNNNVDSSVYGVFPIADIVKTFSKDDAINDLKDGKVVIFAEGTGHPYFTTDTGVVLRTIQMNCDELLMAKSIDGVYDKDPEIHKNAKKYTKISLKEVIEKQLKVIDLSASELALENKLNLRLFSLYEKDSILKAVKGEKIGTFVYSK